MNRKLLLPAVVFFATAVLSQAEGDDNPIKAAMKFAHAAPKGTPKLSEKILDGTAAEPDIKKTLDLYKAMLDTKPPKGDPSAFHDKVAKLITATQEILDHKADGIADYKAAVDCKACHQDFRKKDEHGPRVPGGPGAGGPPPPQ